MWFWQQEANATLRKAQALKSQRKEEYQKAHSSTNRSQEEQSNNTGNKQLEKKRRLEEEALQKVGREEDNSGKSLVSLSVPNSRTCIFVGNLAPLSHPHTVFCIHRRGQAEEAKDHYQNCMADAGVRKMDLANAKSTFLTQIREVVFQCDLTLKAVSRWYIIFLYSQ